MNGRWGPGSLGPSHEQNERRQQEDRNRHDRNNVDIGQSGGLALDQSHHPAIGFLERLRLIPVQHALAQGAGQSIEGAVPDTA